MRECPFSHSRPSYFVILKLLNNYISIEIRLSLVAFQLWRVLEQLAPELFLNYFFKTGDLSMVQLTQKMQKSSKK